MKCFVLVLVIISTPLLALSQNVPNGDFEQWDSLSVSPTSPEGWVTTGFNSTDVPPYYGAERTTDSHTGNFAALLGSINFNSIINNGWIRTGNLSSEYETQEWAFPYSERPENLEFHYKFDQEGGDSAYVKCIFFNYDSITPDLTNVERIDTIAFSSGYIHIEADSYTEFTLPINYYSEEMSEFVSIYFSTSKTIAETANGNFFPGNFTLGTLFWIDDVKFTGGSLSVEALDDERLDLTIFPNPVRNAFKVQANEQLDVQSVSVLDSTGRMVKEWDGLQTDYSIGELAGGIYVILLKTPSAVFVERIMKE